MKVSSEKTTMQNWFRKNTSKTLASFLCVTCFLFFLLAAFFTFSLTACKKQRVDVPASVQTLIDRASCNPSCPNYVNKYLWRNQAVFTFSCSGIACNCVVRFYNDKGEKLTMDSGYYFGLFEQEAQLVEQVWRCK